MSVGIKVPAYMRSSTNNLEAVEVSGRTVGECLDHLVRQFPGMKKRLFTRGGDLFDNIIISINGESAYPEQMARPVRDGDELGIMIVIGGG
jgi:molybdopterin converting factor small subunit